MALELREQFRTKAPVDKDADGNAQSVRVWFASTQNAHAARVAFESDARFKTFPDDPKLLFDGVTVEKADNGAGCFVTARFSNNRSGRLPARKPETWHSDGWSQMKVDVEIPINRYETRVITRNGGEVTLRMWNVTKLKFPEQRSIYWLMVRMKTPQFVQMDEIRKQTNKLHVIRGVTALYLGAEVNYAQIDPTTQGPSFVEIRHQWQFDEGTLKADIGIENEDTIVVLEPSNRQSHQTLLRLPYERFETVSSIDPETAPHETISIKRAVPPDNPWRRLPGAEWI